MFALLLCSQHASIGRDDEETETNTVPTINRKHSTRQTDWTHEKLHDT